MIWCRLLHHTGVVQATGDGNIEDMISWGKEFKELQGQCVEETVCICLKFKEHTLRGDNVAEAFYTMWT